jgi:hypothetical protein
MAARSQYESCMQREGSAGCITLENGAGVAWFSGADIDKYRSK